MAAVLTACGGASSSQSSDPGSAAQGFVAAVTSGNRAKWCSQVGAPLYSSAPQGPLTGSALQNCVSSDLFMITGSCDQERAISGASVTGVQQSGDGAAVALSSGARLEFRRAGGRWLFAGVTTPATHAKPLASGPCAGG